jgi:hypothetical protein
MNSLGGRTATLEGEGNAWTLSGSGSRRVGSWEETLEKAETRLSAASLDFVCGSWKGIRPRARLARSGPAGGWLWPPGQGEAELPHGAHLFDKFYKQINKGYTQNHVISD